MITVKLTASDLEFLDDWKINHKDEVRLLPCPISMFKLVISDCVIIKCTRSSDFYYAGDISNISETLELTYTNTKTDIENTYIFFIQKDGFCRLISHNDVNFNTDFVNGLLSTYCGLMAYITYGDDNKHYTFVKRICDTKKKSKSKANYAKIYTYINRKRTEYIARTTIVGTRTHSSPSVSFNVRGHYRHLKNGKVIWIKEYTKGAGKPKKDTVYKFSKNATVATLNT